MSSPIDFLVNRFHEFDKADAIIYKNEIFPYTQLLTLMADAGYLLDSRGIFSGMTILLEGNYSPFSIAMLLELFRRNCVVVPLLNDSKVKDKIVNLSGVSYLISCVEDEYVLNSLEEVPSPSLIKILQEKKSPGMVLFSSGSTGEPKGVVHDITRFIIKYKKRRFSKRTLSILLFDHIGGLDNLFYTLSNGGVFIICDSLTPYESCCLIEKHKADVFPASPSFLNLLLLSEAYEGKDLSSVEVVTYGAEVMPQSVLLRLQDVFPNARFMQKYGLTEIGTLRSKSKSSDSLWVKVGGEGFETRVADGMLEIKAESAMLGYLNAPSPFTEDGWFMTGDEVEVDGDYYLIKGRRSEIINVGGQKVYPAEVESIIQEMKNVLDVVVSGEKNPILGNMVTAKVHLNSDETVRDFSKRMKLYLKDKLQSFQIPQKVSIENRDFANARFKKIRK